MTFPISNGYYCSCGAWVPNGYFHRCPNRYTPPYSPPPVAPTPMAPVPFTIMPGLTEERVREIVREEIERAKRSDG